MRQAFNLIHRWVGLVVAAFLFIAGVTGAIIAWDHEIDDWLNSNLIYARASGSALSSFDLARAIEERDPQARVTSITLAAETGRSLRFQVTGRINSENNRQYELNYDEVYVDPANGEELGRRKTGQVWPITRETIMPFLVRLHYTLHIPEMLGIERWGNWLMGCIAVMWLIDCFVGLYLTLPARKRQILARAASVERQLAKSFWMRWKPAWVIRTSGSRYRMNFDIHRAFSLWTWAILFILAFTSFSQNFYREAFLPLLSTVSEVSPSPFDTRSRRSRHNPNEPKIGFEEILARGQAEAESRGWHIPAGGIAYSPAFDLYRVFFFPPGERPGEAGVGPNRLYFDAQDGRSIGEWQPWKGTLADIFAHEQFPLHSGRIIGMPGRILISVMGLVVATLSITGVVIWYRKHRARALTRAKSRNSALDTRALAPTE
jgi:uncharacterized iron-regulated membrane protein